jgi:hypothetical protein
MDREELMRMAREAGGSRVLDAMVFDRDEYLERFAALVAAAVKQVDDDTIEYIQNMDAHIDTAVREAVAAERERCAQVCEDHFSSDGHWCAQAIRKGKQ